MCNKKLIAIVILLPIIYIAAFILLPEYLAISKEYQAAHSWWLGVVLFFIIGLIVDVVVKNR